MTGMNLIVDRVGAELELAQGGVLVLREPGRAATKVGVRALANVVLHGEVKLSTTVLRALAETGVALTAVPARGRHPACTFTVSSRRLAGLRHAQHLAYEHSATRLAIAKLIVDAKLEGQRATLTAWGSSVELALVASRVAGAKALDELLGIEGAAARTYFSGFADGFSPPWTFCGRSRRPPEDPVNALLSLGYTLALAECERYTMRFGLDASIGFLHGIAHDRNSLALDMLESVRPVVDRWVALICRRRVLITDRFTFSQTEGCRLDREGREAFYAAWFGDGVPTLGRPLRRLVAKLIAELRVTARNAYDKQAATDEGSEFSC